MFGKNLIILIQLKQSAPDVRIVWCQIEDVVDVLLYLGSQCRSITCHRFSHVIIEMSLKSTFICNVPSLVEPFDAGVN